MCVYMYIHTAYIIYILIIYFVFYLICFEFRITRWLTRYTDQRYVMIPTWIIFHHLPGEHAEIT